MVVLNEKCIWGDQSLTGFLLILANCFSDFFLENVFGPIVIHFTGDNLSGPGGTRDGGVK